MWWLSTINPCHKWDVGKQCRPRSYAADQSLHCLHKGISIKNKSPLGKYGFGMGGLFLFFFSFMPILSFPLEMARHGPTKWLPQTNQSTVITGVYAHFFKVMTSTFIFRDDVLLFWPNEKVWRHDSHDNDLIHTKRSSWKLTNSVSDWCYKANSWWTSIAIKAHTI